LAHLRRVQAEAQITGIPLRVLTMLADVNKGNRRTDGHRQKEHQGRCQKGGDHRLASAPAPQFLRPAHGPGQNRLILEEAAQFVG
jgi:hypothetical protein